MNVIISFRLAKMLKEKGFDKKCNGCYDERGIYGHTILSIKQYYSNSKEDTWNVAAPTIADVVMWLYEKHRIWIEVSCHTVLDEKDNTIEVDLFYFVVRKLKPVKILYSGDFINSPTEAYEAAFEYTLNNLI